MEKPKVDQKLYNSWKAWYKATLTDTIHTNLVLCPHIKSRTAPKSKGCVGCPYCTNRNDQTFNCSLYDIRLSNRESNEKEYKRVMDENIANKLEII